MSNTVSIPSPLFGPSSKADGVTFIAPMYNEVGGAVNLIHEILEYAQVLSTPWEVVIVDDGSTDGTQEALKKAQSGGLNFRILVHAQNAGQSRAIRTAVLAAKYSLIAMVDGDGQNDPADLPRLIAQFQEAHTAGREDLGLVSGERQKRQDSGAKRFGSRFANNIRQSVLKDGAQDSGCGLKVFSRDAFLRLPFFDHCHRYLPFLMQREGFAVEFAPVQHRARAHGASKYTNLGRLLVAIRDLLGVLWLKSRARSPKIITEHSLGHDDHGD